MRCTLDAMVTIPTHCQRTIMHVVSRLRSTCFNMWGLSNVLLITPGTHRRYPIITLQPGPQLHWQQQQLQSHIYRLRKRWSKRRWHYPCPWSKGRMARATKYRGLRTFGDINQFCPFPSPSLWPQSPWYSEKVVGTIMAKKKRILLFFRKWHNWHCHANLVKVGTKIYQATFAWCSSVTHPNTTIA